ncbi:MAG: hypothetical protein WCJ30_05110 [Deltaproteobacteria bacterium]
MRSTSRVNVAPILVAVLAVALAVLTGPRAARAQESVACDACASCTTALAQPRARAHIEHDLESAGATGACIVVAGQNAQFDARGHAIRTAGAGSIGVQVTGQGVLVRNVNVTGAGVGIDVAGAERVTVFHATLDTHEIGIRVTAARSVRIARSHIAGARVGIAFGEAAGAQCPAAVLRSPGAVIARNVLERNGTAIAACEAAPVLTDNVIVRNQIGLVLGAPSRGADGPGADGPYDPCLCAPPLDHVRTGTTILYSSGCGGCQVHEGWLPDLRRGGHDIRARETGLANVAAGQRFDDYVAQCVPEIADSLGIPGCVPNYACPATDVVFKIRQGADGMRYEARLDSPDDVARFATACEAGARANYGEGAACVRRAVRGNVVCGNRNGDIHAAAGARRSVGAGNSCGTADGWTDEGATGCAQPCPTTLPTTADAPPAGADTPEQPHAAAPPAAPAPTAAVPPTAPPSTVAQAPSAADAGPVARAATSDTGSEGRARAPAPAERSNSSTMIIVACLAGIAGLVFFALRRPG